MLGMSVLLASSPGRVYGRNGSSKSHTHTYYVSLIQYFLNLLYNKNPNFPFLAGILTFGPKNGSVARILNLVHFFRH